jgi:uncharacterized membrane protein
MTDRRILLGILGIAVVATVVGGVLTGTLVGGVRLVGGLLILALPGFAVSYAVVPDHTLEASRRAAIVLTSAIGTLVLGALLLNETPSGIVPLAWVALIVTVTLVASVVAVARGAVSVETIRSPRRWLPSRFSTERRRTSPPIRGVVAVVALVVGIGLAGVSLAVARVGAIDQNLGQSYTEFWAQPDPASPGTIEVGVTSHEARPTGYAIVVTADGTDVGAPKELTLVPGETRVTRIEVPADARTIDAYLYREGAPQAYRHVSLLTGSPS